MAGLNRSSSNGSSSARTRLRGMLTSAFDSSSTYGRLTFGEKRSKLLATAGQQRTDHRPVARMHRREASRSRAAEQTEQEGLGLIVARVAEGDDARIETDARPLEKTIARRARGILDRAVLAPRARRDVFTFHAQRPSERRGEVGAESLVTIRGAAQLMIEVGEPNRPQLARRVERPDDMCERDRVRPARQRDRDASVAARQRVLTNEPPDAVDQMHDGWWVGWGSAGEGPPAPRTADRWLASRAPARPGEGWCRRTDSNRRPRAYETRALTN